jgi:hypothetical protein
MEEQSEPFETVLLNEQLKDCTIEEKLAEFGLSVEEAIQVREFQESFSLRLLLIYLRLRGKAKRYHQKYGDYFTF